MRRGSRLGTALVLLALWLFATAWNVDKAYHIDDTAHLEIAQWIAEQPLRPMSGYVHWESQDEPRPIHKTNQPHLYFYAMAGWGSLFGWSERSIHLLLSIFTLVAIVTMYGLASGVAARAPLLITSFLALGPAFVVGQNTMVDVPVLAAWLVFYWALLTSSIASDRRRFLIAAAACSAALLIKYTSLVLLPILVVHIVARRRRDLWYLAALPVVVLVGWSLFNWLDYGGVHVLERETAVRSAEEFGSRALVWLLCLGAIAPFAAYFYVHASSRLPRAWDILVRALVLGTLAGLVALAIAFWSGATSEDGVFRFLRVAFVLNGAVFLAIALAALLLRSRRSLGVVDGTLVYWVLSCTAFIVLVAPFVAVRHVLLIVPPLLLLAQRWQVRVRTAWAVVAVAGTVVLTSLIAASDWWYADVYRDQAREIRATLPRDATVWFTGHWGWQWYAKQNGMRQANAVGEEQPAVGDYVVTPRNVSPTSVGSGTLILERCTPVPRTSFLQSFAAQKAGFYASDLRTLPWALSREPIEEFCIYRRGAD